MSIINTTLSSGNTAMPSDIAEANVACTGPKWQVSEVENNSITVNAKLRVFPNIGVQDDDNFEKSL